MGLLDPESLIVIEKPVPEEIPWGPLTPEQQNEFRKCEAVIEKKWQTFVELGQALARIRDGRLYRDQYASFEAYCRQRWAYGRHYANHLIAAAEVVAHLVTIVTTAPHHESQVRPLLGLTKDQAVTAWQAAVESAKGGPVTAQLVKAAAVRFKPPSLKRTTASKRLIAGEGERVLSKAIELLKQVEVFLKEGKNPQITLNLVVRIRGDLTTLAEMMAVET